MATEGGRTREEQGPEGCPQENKAPRAARAREGQAPKKARRLRGGTLGRGCLSPRPHQADWRAVIRA